MEDIGPNPNAPSLRISTFGLLIAMCISGCMQAELNSAAISEPTLPPVNRPADNYEWIKRLKICDPLEGIPQMNRGQAQMAYPIPVPITAGSRFSLLVDQQMKLAWLHTPDGKLGPWPLDQPDVTHLLKSVAIPPTNASTAQ